MVSSLSGRPDIQWTNLDPEQLLEELGPFASLEGFRELLDKAQVGQAYVGRPCLDPDDLHCPPSAPNRDSRQVGPGPGAGKGYSPPLSPPPVFLCYGREPTVPLLCPPSPGRCYPVCPVLDT